MVVLGSKAKVRRLPDMTRKVTYVWGVRGTVPSVGSPACCATSGFVSEDSGVGWDEAALSSSCTGEGCKVGFGVTPCASVVVPVRVATRSLVIECRGLASSSFSTRVTEVRVEDGFTFEGSSPATCVDKGTGSVPAEAAVPVPLLLLSPEDSWWVIELSSFPSDMVDASSSLEMVPKIGANINGSDSDSDTDETVKP